PGAAETQPGKGQSFMDWYNADQFASDRRDNIYYPWASQSEWEMASFLLRSSLTMGEIDEFLSLQMVKDRLSFSFSSAKELRARAELLPSGPPWKAKTITYEGYPTKTPLVLYYRDPLECIRFLLNNPLLKNHLDLTPKKTFRDGKRVIGEWVTGDGAWGMQAALPPGSTLLGTILTSDKTNISVMNGDRVAHPLLTSLANI
ncbi:hypothetical protein B0H11DRAFT_1693331, partial [Mycena galericulata]